jgi:dihydrofolate reductase
MTQLKLDISMSLDGCIAGPDAGFEKPLGEGGEDLHAWVVGLKAWREPHGEAGGEENLDGKIVAETVASTGAVIMGRRMFSGGSGPWEDDPNAAGWWGDEPPFGVPVFVLTHHEREPEEKQGGTTFNFVTGGIESALEQARAAAGDRNVHLAGGADVVQQYLRAGLLDEIQIHLIPLFLGGGVRLFDELHPARLEQTRLVESPAGLTHVRYSVVR